MNEKKCCFCGDEMRYSGCNASPFGSGEDSCCDLWIMTPVKDALYALGYKKGSKFMARLDTSGERAEIFRDGALIGIYDFNKETFVD